MIKQRTNLNTYNTDFFRTLGFNHSDPHYVYIGHDNAFIASELNKKIYYKNMIPLLYFRNILPLRSVEYQKFNWEIDISTLKTESWFCLYSQRKFKTVFGCELSHSTNIAYYDITANNLITPRETKVNFPINTAETIVFTNTQLSVSNFMVLFNAITIQKIVPKYEKLISPFILDARYTPYSEYVQNNSVQITVPTTGVIPDTYTLDPMKVVIKAGGTYYTFTTMFEPITLANPPYITRSEIVNNGIDLHTFNTIPDAHWDSLDCRPIYVVSCGYMFPTYIDSRFWADEYDISYFVWAVARKKKYVFTIGEI